MKKLSTVTAVAFVLSGGAAQAGNAFDWSGVYAGVYGGVDWASGRQNDFYELQSFGNPSDPWGATISGNSFAYGGTLGLNKQLSSGLVVGLELDAGKAASASGQFGNSHGNDPNTLFSLNGGFTGSGRVRLGYAAGDVLPFVTGGVAYESFGVDALDNYDCAETCSVAHFTGNGQAFGWTVGAGVDYAISEHAVVGVEYRYSNLGTSSVAAANQDVGQTRDYQVNLNESALRGSLTFKF